MAESEAIRRGLFSRRRRPAGGAGQPGGYPTLSEEADAEYELESEEGSLWTGTRLLIGLCAMMWAAVAFAYFYLRTIDINLGGQAWRAHGVTTPPPLLGALIPLCVVAGAIMLTYGAWNFRRGLAFEWSVGAWVATILGVAATGFQGWELGRLNFYPGESGYTSLFIGFAGLNAAFILGGAFWAETLAARTTRLAKEIGPEDYMGASTHPEVRMFRASISGGVYFWWFMAAIDLFFWVLFYVLK